LNICRRNRSIRSQEGFTYIGVLLAVALIGIQLALAGVVWSFAQTRQKERELLFVGDQFRTAIGRYYFNLQGSQKEYPKRLDDLVRDSRYPGTVRHIRKIYADPITGKARWRLITTPDCRIIGVHSLSEKAPIKVGNFLPPYNTFEKKARYADWLFVYTIGTPTGRPTGSPGTATPTPNASSLPKASNISACPKFYSPEGDEGVEKDGTATKTFTGSDILSDKSLNTSDKRLDSQPLEKSDR
jgi:type II secretory pathway pseudopilin PulG